VVAEPEEEQESQLPLEQIDRIVTEIFFKAITESVKEKDFPLEPSEFQRTHFNNYYCEDHKVDLRQSSYKRIGKLLEEMAKK